MQKKYFIKNRSDEKICVLIDFPSQPQGTAVIIHGLSGTKDQPHIKAIADAFYEKGYIAIRFDTTDTFGESDGIYENATVTGALQDLEDVIAWAKTQPWFISPYCLIGHSMGSLAALIYAESHPDEIKALAPTSAAVSAHLFAEGLKPEEIKSWQETGYLAQQSQSRPEIIKKLKWSFVLDAIQYDTLPQAQKLTMPVLLVVGEKDFTTPLKHQQILLDALPGPKELHIIKDSVHTFKTQPQLNEFKNIFLAWIDGLNKK